MSRIIQQQMSLSMLLDAPTQLIDWARQRLGLATTLYLAALSTMLGVYVLLLPISSADTDLWYHLNGGRLFWEFDQFPQDAFYSFFNAEDREWINYFWGFQALTYLIYDLSGYPGLIALRLVLVAVAFASIATILIRPTDRPAQRAWALAVLALVMLVFVGRTALIRPHLASYAMIPLFIMILQHRRRWLPALPLLTILWINLHGTEWPVGALICGTFALGTIWQWRREGTASAQLDWQMIGWTTACLPAALLNPFGVQILTAPFNFSSELYLYISELKQYPPLILFTLDVMGPVIEPHGAIAILAWGNLAALAALLIRRNLQLVPLLLAMGGVYLLSKGARFVWEWLLLSLPLWRAAIDTVHVQAADRRLQAPGISHLLLLLLLIAPFVTWSKHLGNSDGWPVDTSKLPSGISDFLVEQGITGRMLSPQTPGGYLAWRLYPNILISGDMQAPPTTPWDHFRRNASVRNGAALARMIEQQDPTLIAIEIEYKSFANLIAAHPEYNPVFFDDLLALYADAEQLPELVRTHELRHINPFNLNDRSSGSTEERLVELRRVLAVDPDGDRVQHAITRLLFDEERYDDALESARAFVKTVPDNTNSHFLLGNSLENLDRFEEAEQHFLNALDYAPEDFRPVLYRHLGACAYLRKDFGKAVDYFEQGINAYRYAVEPEAFFQYAVSAAATGDTDKATTLSRQLLYALPLGEQALRARTEALLADLEP